jgi:hypothetical protein
MKRIAAFSIILILLGTPNVLLASKSDYKTTYNYVIRFYPRWLSWMQAQNFNQLVGPFGMGPEFKTIVAINDDTLYASAFLDLSNGPQILTVPAYPNIYSILQLDCFGDIFKTDLSPTPSGGVYALVGPHDKSELPPGVTRIQLPYSTSMLIVRADKYSPQGVNHIQAAEVFRMNLQLQSVTNYMTDPAGGKTSILPLYIFSPPVKRMADETITFATESFLKTLQEAMASPTTQPLTASDKNLIRKFNQRFKAAQKSTKKSGRALSDINEGAMAAYAALINRWLSHINENNWIHFDNIGHWGKSYLDRAALTEYLQYGNDLAAAYYAHAFMDSRSIPLDGSAYRYVIHFSKDQLPQQTRFWSITAYTPEDIELVENPINKYVVASYTPGLVYDRDGGLTVYLQANMPRIAPRANWLPVPSGPFNVMLRIYGPLGSASDGTYVPPGITNLPYEE